MAAIAAGEWEAGEQLETRWYRTAQASQQASCPDAVDLRFGRASLASRTWSRDEHNHTGEPRSTARTKEDGINLGSEASSSREGVSSPN